MPPGCPVGSDQASQAESGRPGQPGHAPVVRGGQLADLTGGNVDDAQLPVMCGDRHDAAVGRGGQLADPAELAGREPARRRSWTGAVGPPPISNASVPPASVAQTTAPADPSTCGYRARTPGDTASATAGPSR